MKSFLVETRYVPDKYGEVRPRHREYLRKLAEEGVCLVAGPLADGSGGVMLFRAEDAEALQKILDTDPYHLEGALAERSVREYTPVLGSWVS
ncbi:YciI family protein [Amycolatopsis cynarae]|uniref:YciI family protein n=1 Tax=Amycolatopsis cynarae TaxID=2995223 RepID=A0ABY7B2W2_9PSEU|nr:YciI family protein [Amycolatopsis sp. HUAS 11-8]WAL65784.1 YciI family protein [Amycolatopsis sp. HUAS 11-8]